MLLADHSLVAELSATADAPIPGRAAGVAPRQHPAFLEARELRPTPPARFSYETGWGGQGGFAPAGIHTQ